MTLRHLACVLLIGALFESGCDQKVKCAEGCEQFGAVCDTASGFCVDGKADLGIDFGGADQARDIEPIDMTEIDLKPPPDLMPECVASSTCPSAMPICDTTAQECRACAGTADDSGCASRDSMKGYCLASAGACVECRENANCATATRPICEQTAGATANTCRGCSSHTDCASLVCNSDGSCQDASTIVYVNNRTPDNTAACAGTTHAGTLADPYCQIGDGITNRGTKQIVRVLGSSDAYRAVSITSGSATALRVLGPGSEASVIARIYELDVAGFVVAVGSGNLNITLEGVVVGDPNNVNTNKRGIACQGSGATVTFAVRDVVAQKAGAEGLFSDACTLTIDRVTVSHNSGAGVSVSGGSATVARTTVHGNTTGIELNTANYIVENTLVAQNSQTGVVFNSSDPASTSRFWFNTVVLNGALNTRGGISCGSPPSGIRPVGQTAIVFNSQNTGGGSTQIGGDCVLTDVVVGTSDLTSLSDAIKQNPAFVNDSPAAMSTADMLRSAFMLQTTDTVCVDQVAVSSGQPMTDLFGTSRPQGTMLDIGAYESN